MGPNEIQTGTGLVEAATEVATTWEACDATHKVKNAKHKMKIGRKCQLMWRTVPAR